jgi:hypothetical protein
MSLNFRCGAIASESVPATLPQSLISCIFALREVLCARCATPTPHYGHTPPSALSEFHDQALLFREARLAQHTISTPKDSGGDVCGHVVPPRVHDPAIFWQRA